MPAGPFVLFAYFCYDMTEIFSAQPYMQIKYHLWQEKVSTYTLSSKMPNKVGWCISCTENKHALICILICQNVIPWILIFIHHSWRKIKWQLLCSIPCLKHEKILTFCTNVWLALFEILWHFLNHVQTPGKLLQYNIQYRYLYCYRSFTFSLRLCSICSNGIMKMILSLEMKSWEVGKTFLIIELLRLWASVPLKVPIMPN